MKLYMHPVSMTSRPVRLFVAEKGLKVDEEVVDLFTGAHHQEPYASLNPNRLVPMIEDDGFRLTESSAILKYLAEKHNLPEYPKDLKARARVNEMMDWFNTNFYRDYAYGLAYPQLFPHHKRRSDEAHAATIEWGRENAKRWLQILNDHWIGPDKPYLCGKRDPHRGLFRGRPDHARRGDPLRLRPLSQHPPLARQHEEAQELEARQRALLRPGRAARGAAVRRRVSGRSIGSHQPESVVLRDRDGSRRSYGSWSATPPWSPSRRRPAASA
ncbi:MAG: glutathione S-transferase family protein [Xanthobacteraceae bacterium]|nr:glutathione S-transferase family protein [Xanthobacteraceae bacterium]